MLEVSHNHHGNGRVSRLARRNTASVCCARSYLVRAVLSSYGNLELLAIETANALHKRKKAFSCYEFADTAIYYATLYYKKVPPAWVMRKVLREPLFSLTNAGWRLNDVR